MTPSDAEIDAVSAAAEVPEALVDRIRTIVREELALARCAADEEGVNLP